MRSSSIKRLVLVGAGHSHLTFLKKIYKKIPIGWEIFFINPKNHPYYSGSIPAYLAGWCGKDDCYISLSFIQKFKRITFLEDLLVNILSDTKEVHLASGKKLSYSLLSLDIGASIRTISGFDPENFSHLALRPFENFFSKIYEWDKKIQKQSLLIIGAGAAGCELAIALSFRYPKAKIHIWDTQEPTLPMKFFKKRKILFQKKIC